MSDRPIPIVIAAPPLNTGGTEHHLLHILPALKERGFDISVVLLAAGGILQPALTAGVDRVISPGRKWPRPVRTLQQAWLIRKAARRAGATVVHGFLSEPSLAAATANLLMTACLEQRPALVHGRRSLAFYSARHGVARWFERASHSLADALVGNSNAVSAELIKESGQPDKVCTIWNGIPIAGPLRVKERSECRRMFNLPDDAFVLTYVANFYSYKGHEDLIHALSRIADRMPQPWRLLLPGRDGGAEHALRRKIHLLGLDENVVFPGEWPGSRQPYAAADVGLLVSHTEGFSNSLIEGMMTGLPMIATHVGGNVDAVDYGETGILVPPHSPDDLADAILKLSVSPDFRSALGAAAREKALRHFSLESCIDQYEKLWRGLSERRPGRPADWLTVV
jgi:glycosyltransferase involved in cell wall biosynthesis